MLLSTRQLERVGAGVYRAAGAPVTWKQRVYALTMAAGPNAAASHRSAAALLGMYGFRQTVVEVTTPRPRHDRGSHGQVIVHRWRPFPDQHLTVVDGITTTRVARTLVDLAGVLHPLATERAVDNCLSAKMVDYHELRGTFYELASRGRKGVATIREILDARSPLYIPPASDGERAFLALLHAAGLPEPVRQLDVGDEHDWIGRIDLAYPTHRIVIEVDSDRHHTSKLDREADALRDRRLRAAGWIVVRVSESELRTGAPAAIRQLRELLAAPPTRPPCRTGATQVPIR